MSRFRVRLTFILIALIGLSVLAAGLLTGHYYRENHQSSLREHMIRELQVLIAAVPWPASDDPAAQTETLLPEAVRFKELADMRITFIRTDGIVVGDSDRDPATMDNHSDRSEVREALADGIGTGLRRSDTLGDQMLYVAMAVQDGDRTLGVARLAMSLSDVERSLNRMWLALVGGLLLLFALAAGISYRVALSVTKPLERMTSAAKRMANMDYAVRIPDAGRDEIGELARALNAMSGSLQVQLNQIRQNGNRLQSVLDNMTSGVVMIARDGRVTLFNREAEQLLGMSARDRVGRSYAEWRQHYELAGFIREGIERMEPLHDELSVYYPEERLLAASIVPMSADDMADAERQSADGGAADDGAADDGLADRGEQPLEAGLLLVLQDVTAIRRLERMRSEFVANVSHELKTPVAAVKGFAETLLNGAMNDAETAKSFLTIIYDESDRLNRLIGDILELSKIESRRSPLQFEPIDASVFFMRMKELLSTDAAKKGIELDWQLEEGLFLEADEDRLGQIILNLVQNGINYTPEGGKVKVTVETVRAEGGEADGDGEMGEGAEERVKITVADTGIGIPKKDLPRIFERFYRVDKARSRSSGGTGLGLSIVKHLVELHHGSIRVESTVGVGSKFILELPHIQP